MLSSSQKRCQHDRLKDLWRRRDSIAGSPPHSQTVPVSAGCGARLPIVLDSERSLVGANWVRLLLALLWNTLSPDVRSLAPFTVQRTFTALPKMHSSDESKVAVPEHHCQLHKGCHTIVLMHIRIYVGPTYMRIGITYIYIRAHMFILMYMHT